jgi:hypothetical protein
MEIAISPAIAAGSPEPAISEPISPELVLVDPELRRAVQAEALDRAPLRLVMGPQVPRPAQAPDRAAVAYSDSPGEAQPAALPVVSLPLREAKPRRAGRVLAGPRRYLVRAILPISLILNAILITLAVSDATVSPQPTASGPSLSATALDNKTETPSPAAKAKRRATQTGGAAAVPARRPTSPRFGARDPRLERKLLNLIIQAPAGKLPRALINAKTGLAKNNLQAVCRSESGRRTFLCLVQPAKHNPGEGLYARYRPNRKGTGGTFSWYSYRKG